MKKIILIILSFIIAFSAYGCKDQTIEPDNKSTNDVYDPNNGIDLSSDDIVIINNNSSNYSICYRESALDGEKYAAKELSDFIKLSAGVELEVKAEAEVKNDKFISIGKTKKLAALNLNFDYKTLNYDGFFIKTNGNSIFIDGDNERGCIFGAYEFLERFLGIRFVTEECTHIPKLTKLAVKTLNIIEKPIFRFRNYFSGAGYNGDAKFYARNKMYEGDKKEHVGFNEIWSEEGLTHNSIKYLPKETYGEGHPEFYGSTTNLSLKDSGYDDLCYSNGVTPDGKLDETMEKSVAKGVIESLTNFAIAQPNVTSFFIGIADHMGGGCRCKTCRERESLADGNRAAPLIVFMNLISREMKKILPTREINIGFFAYFWTETPPTKIDENGNVVPFSDLYKLEDNLFPRFAPLKANGAYGIDDERQKPSVRNNLKNWAVLSNNLMIWDYNCDFSDYSRYFPDLNFYQDNIKLYEKLKVSSLFSQSSWTSQSDWQGKLKFYIASKLFWHSNHDVSALIKEFCSLYYGEKPATKVLEFIDIMENHFAFMRSQQGYLIDYTAYSPMYHDYEFMPIAVLEKGVDLINSAKQLVIEDSSLSQLQKTELLGRLSEVMVTPMGMIMRDYSNYYVDIDNRVKFFEEYMKNITDAGIDSLGESTTVNKYLTKYNII